MWPAVLVYYYTNRIGCVSFFGIEGLKFPVYIITASFIALIVISMGSSWGVTEAMGWGKKHWFSQPVRSRPALHQRLDARHGLR